MQFFSRQAVLSMPRSSRFKNKWWLKFFLRPQKNLSSLIFFFHSNNRNFIALQKTMLVCRDKYHWELLLFSSKFPLNYIGVVVVFPWHVNGRFIVEPTESETEVNICTSSLAIFFSQIALANNWRYCTTLPAKKDLHYHALWITSVIYCPLAGLGSFFIKESRGVWVILEITFCLVSFLLLWLLISTSRIFKPKYTELPVLSFPFSVITPQLVN